jgi:hypothetical protein
MDAFVRPGPTSSAQPYSLTDCGGPMSDQPGWTSPSWDPTQRGIGDPPSGAGSAPPPPPYVAPPIPAPPPPPGYGYGYGYGYQYQPQTPKPGIIPLRPLGLGEILDGAVSVIRQNWQAMVGLSVAVVAVLGLFRFLLDVTLLRDAATSGSTFFSFNSSDSLSTGASVSGSDLAALLVVLATNLLTWAATILLTGILSVIVSQAVLGQRATLGDAWGRVRPQLGRLVGLSIMVSVFWFLGLLLCVIPGIFLWVALSVSAPALVLERGTVFGSMGRSRRLVTNLWWRTFGILLLTALVSFVVALVVEIPILIVGVGSAFATGIGSTDGDYVLAQLLTAVASIIAGALTYPFVASVSSLLYVDMRMRKEGLDIELMRAAGATPPQYGRHYGQYGQPPA